MNLNSVAFFESVNQKNFRNMIKELNLVPPIIIKPNWGFSVVYTEAKILDWILSAIDDEVIIIESYGWARNKEAVTKKEYGPMGVNDLRSSDQWFLDFSGIGKILKKHNVEYINITEEVWAKRIVDPTIIQRHVEDLFPPVHNEEMYSYVPQRLYEMKKGTLLSLAKLKFMDPPLIISLSIKNLFGMLPGPDRGKFHGMDNESLDQSVLDINKIYRSLFNVNGIVEAIFTASRGMTLDPTIYKEIGMVWASKNTVELDAQVCTQVGLDPNLIGHIKVAAECFGYWDENQLTQNQKNLSNIFP
ncbi:MAG: DUF362 domain-containing protein [Candidatus Hodarchaeota archaeon]